MSDIADVEQALCDAVLRAIYPRGVTGGNVVGCDVKIYRGWPNASALGRDISAGSQTVTVTAMDRSTTNTTRYAPVWRTATTREPTCGVSVQNGMCVFEGIASQGDLIGIEVDGVAYSHLAAGGDDPLSIALAFNKQIAGSMASGGRISFPFASQLTARVVGPATSVMEARRQEQKILIALWCSSPVKRDITAQTIDLHLSSLDWLPIADGSYARLIYDSTAEKDDSVNAGVYRRDLVFRTEYATLLREESGRMLFGTGTYGDGHSGHCFGDKVAARSIILPRLGAIRFDAWYDPANPIDIQCAAALSDATFSERLPVNADVRAGSVSWPLASQAVIDAEIDAACAAGLSFWAFDSYPAGDSLSLALQLYLTSSARSRIEFCLIGQSSTWSDPEAARKAYSRDIALMSQPGYVKVGGNRPLYFLLDASPAQLAGLGLEGVAAQIASLRTHAIETGVNDPYIVWLSGAAMSTYDNTAPAARSGADAAGCYCCPVLDGDVQSYSALKTTTSNDWNRRSSAGIEMVPTAMCGWDQRPLVEHPQAFYPLSPDLTPSNYYAAGSALEIAEHIADMAEFILNKPDVCVAQIGLVYAWNELAEGGWLMPTRSPDGADRTRSEMTGAALTERASRLVDSYN